MSNSWKYWKFYWPLSIMGIVMLSGGLVKNYVLLDFEDGVRELALFALAISVYHTFDAALIFAPQMATVLVRGRKSFRATLGFVTVSAVILTLPVAILAWTPLGPIILPQIYKKDPESIHRIIIYMRFITPLLMMEAWAKYCLGLLIQAHRTGMVTCLRAVNLSILIGGLSLGVGLRLPPYITVCVSWMAAEMVHLVLSILLVRRYHKLPTEPEAEELTQRKIFNYFWPMAVNTFMFALSRPIIFSFITGLNPNSNPNLPNVDAILAGLTLTFSFTMLFQQTVNQFRHLVVAFGREDMAGVQRFMITISGGVSVLLFLSAGTGVSDFFFTRLQGASGPAYEMARQALWIMCLAPAVITWRNYYHGLAMVHRRTFSMGVGGISRNAAIFLFSFILVRLGLYGHLAGAAMMLTGFATEALAVMIFSRAWRRELHGANK